MHFALTDALRRDPFDAYDMARRNSPVMHVPPPFNGWMIFDYATVKAILTDHQTFSSAVPAPPHWFIFTDAPEHARLRGLISRAFTPRSIANLESRIRELSAKLFDGMLQMPEMDLVAHYSGPLPMMVIAQMLGIPPEDWPRYLKWSNSILRISHARSSGPDAQDVMTEFAAVSAEMGDYLIDLILKCRAHPGDDLFTRLVHAEIDGQRLTHADLLGFFQILLVAGQETTTNLINNAVLCLTTHPDQLALLRARPDLLPSAIEEVLRYRSPLQWLMRTPTRDIELHGQHIKAHSMLFPVLGSANRDPAQFPDPDRFDITRNPNPHIAFGHGAHFCMGTPLSRLEASIALTDFLNRFSSWQLPTARDWVPRPALHVHGPASLPIQIGA